MVGILIRLLFQSTPPLFLTFFLKTILLTSTHFLHHLPLPFFPFSHTSSFLPSSSLSFHISISSIFSPPSSPIYIHCKLLPLYPFFFSRSLLPFPSLCFTSLLIVTCVIHPHNTFHHITSSISHTYFQ